jgi:hypothetical protein
LILEIDAIRKGYGLFDHGLILAGPLLFALDRHGHPFAVAIPRTLLILLEHGEADIGGRLAQDALRAGRRRLA